ncbi:N-terminal double-transmembrane domain-containing protein [Halopelagius inordinatus]|uniref:N-terminal double-transmembrane domain-containing protein n=1 Tax=Halopelagius inordinatus TaxID=553467 RepID=A0A1I2P5N8_9EURY|nr:BatA and WFA domain-containing protein [Halopelagius inordinatus]SFG08791.1 N-terminal double-transmembrane domain-containing protein [Halopelagius inordinatus]
MALSDVFLTPLGLAALLLAVPIVVLYLVRPDPRKVKLPTFRFLAEDRREDASNPLFERLQRSVLLLLQLLAVLLFATALATPYVPVSESSTVEETVLVVDASASMGVQSDGTTRFARAVDAAREEVTGTTSVVVADGQSTVALRRGDPGEARTTVTDLSVTESPGDLRSAISTATAVAGSDARIVVASDFADDGPWRDAVRVARSRGLTVDLRQFAAGGDDNVGVVGRSFSGAEVTVSVKNYGDSEATRTVSLGGERRSVTLSGGDVRSVTLPVPAGGGELELSPGDSFPADDTSYVAAPDDASVDVLVLTNDENTYLTTALSVVDAVKLTVDNPPTTVEGDYDVIVYSNVEGDRLLAGNIEAGRALLADGGGVAIQAQESMPGTYGDLLLVNPDGVRSNPTLDRPADDTLTRGIGFPPPEAYVNGTLRDGRALVSTTEGTPILATARRGEGRLLYYGYIEQRSAFKYDYQYPVFWKRAVYHLAGRPPLSQLNAETGGRLQFGGETTVETPDGAVTASSVRLDDAGFYRADGTRYSASLLSESESAVVADDIESSEEGGVVAREESRTVPKPLTHWAALAALVGVLGEVAYLRRRGDL